MTVSLAASLPCGFCLPTLAGALSVCFSGFCQVGVDGPILQTRKLSSGEGMP